MMPAVNLVDYSVANNATSMGSPYRFSVEQTLSSSSSSSCFNGPSWDPTNFTSPFYHPSCIQFFNGHLVNHNSNGHNNFTTSRPGFNAGLAPDSDYYSNDHSVPFNSGTTSHSVGCGGSLNTPTFELNRQCSTPPSSYYTTLSASYSDSYYTFPPVCPAPSAPVVQPREYTPHQQQQLQQQPQQQQLQQQQLMRFGEPQSTGYSTYQDQQQQLHQPQQQQFYYFGQHNGQQEASQAQSHPGHPGTEGHGKEAARKDAPTGALKDSVGPGQASSVHMSRPGKLFTPFDHASGRPTTTALQVHEVATAQDYCPDKLAHQPVPPVAQLHSQGHRHQEQLEQQQEHHQLRELVRGPRPSGSNYSQVSARQPGGRSGAAHLCANGFNQVTQVGRQENQPAVSVTAPQVGGGHQQLISRRKNATRETTATLKEWLDKHDLNPYPSKSEKIMLSIITKMSLNQVSTWFANARRRMKKEHKVFWATNKSGGSAPGATQMTTAMRTTGNSSGGGGAVGAMPPQVTGRVAGPSEGASGSDGAAGSLRYFIQKHQKQLAGANAMLALSQRFEPPSFGPGVYSGHQPGHVMEQMVGPSKAQQPLAAIGGSESLERQQQQQQQTYSDGAHRYAPYAQGGPRFASEPLSASIAPSSAQAQMMAPVPAAAPVPEHAPVPTPGSVPAPVPGSVPALLPAPAPAPVPVSMPGPSPTPFAKLAQVEQVQCQEPDQESKEAAEGRNYLSTMAFMGRQQDSLLSTNSRNKCCSGTSSSTSGGNSTTSGSTGGSTSGSTTRSCNSGTGSGSSPTIATSTSIGMEEFEL